MKLKFKHLARPLLTSRQDKYFSSFFFASFTYISLILPHVFFILFLFLVLRVCGSPTREDPGYASVKIESHLQESHL